MRVLFSLLDAQVGGGQRVAYTVARELLRRGHSVGVMAPSHGSAVEEFEGLGAAFHLASIGSLRGTADVRVAVSAVRGYDVLYSHTSIPGQLLGDISARVTRHAHVVHQHTVPRVSPSAGVGATHRALYRATVARRPIIAVAPHVRRALLALGARPGLVEVVPNGVDIDELTRIVAAIPSHNGIRVGMLARFDPQKGLDVFLATAAPLRDSHATFTIGASGNAYPEHASRIRAEARALAVDVVDPGDDGASFLAGLDIVVMPSLRAEGSPLTLLEAMGMGKAVVASDVEGIGTIPGISEAARLVTPGDAAATAAEIRELIDAVNDREALGARAAAMVRERYRAVDAARTAADIVERSTI